MRSLSVTLVLLTLLLPMTGAHTPPGPKNFCETTSDVPIHDYVGPWTPTGPDVKSLTSGYQIVSANGNIDGDCDGDTVPGDSDGHMDWATGGATLLAQSWGGLFWNWEYQDYDAIYGSQVCLGEGADHVPLTTITAVDSVVGGAVAFGVYSDWPRLSLTYQTVEDRVQRTLSPLSQNADQVPTVHNSPAPDILDYVPPPPPPPPVVPHEQVIVCGDGVIEPCDPADPTAIDQVNCNAWDHALFCEAGAIGSLSNSCTPTFGPGANGDYLVEVYYDANPGHPSLPVAGHIIN